MHKIEGTLTGEKYALILDNFVRAAFNEYAIKYNQLDYYQEDNDPKHGGPRGAKIIRG